MPSVAVEARSDAAADGSPVAASREIAMCDSSLVIATSTSVGAAAAAAPGAAVADIDGEPASLLSAGAAALGCSSRTTMQVTLSVVELCRLVFTSARLASSTFAMDRTRSTAS